MDEIDINSFSEEKDCIFEGEKYSVRDNGAILRHPKENSRKRANDNIWTFGKENNQNPYLLFAGVRVHRIVATAFLGEPPNSTYVVDHKDTNCRNNRPENLQWLTRLENALKNPITRKKIEFLCGSIEAFLENPKIIRTKAYDRSIDWMRTVTPEEAKNCKVRMDLWANTKNKGSNPLNINYSTAFKDRVYRPLYKWEADLSREPGLDFAKTPWCAQYMWDTDAEFPCCPKELYDNPMQEYLNNIEQGKLFAFNETNSFPKLYAYKTIILNENKSWFVICKRDDDKWNVIGVELNKKRHFIHFNLGCFKTNEEAEEFTKTINDEMEFGWKGYSCKWDV